MSQFASTIFHKLPQYLLTTQEIKAQKEKNKEIKTQDYWNLFQVKNFDNSDIFNIDNVQTIKGNLKVKDNEKLKVALKDLKDNIFHPKKPNFKREDLFKFVGSDKLLDLEFLCSMSSL